MSQLTDKADRDGKTGRFVSGNSGGPGRKVGARNKLGEAFVADLRDAWEEHGPDVIARVARDDPAALLKVIASLMPRDYNINQTVGVDAQNVLDAFRSAVSLLGNEAPTRLPKVKVIDAG
ncbi:hypothetical protein RAD15_05020 [Bradyrhizobium sp. 14AA]